MVGQLCSVIGCTNGYYRLNKWKDSVCDQHAPEKRVNCACLLPYALHLFPRNETIRRQWIVAVNRKDFNPKKNSVVCSHHFVDQMPTHKNPVPSINLGNEEKDKPGHRKHRRRPPIPKKQKSLHIFEEDEEIDYLSVSEGKSDRVKEGPCEFVWTADSNLTVSRSTCSMKRSHMKTSMTVSHPANENIDIAECDIDQVVLNPADTVEIVVEVSGLIPEYALDEDITK